jgi:hypothetical protein
MKDWQLECSLDQKYTGLMSCDKRFYRTSSDVRGYRHHERIDRLPVVHMIFVLLLGEF